MSNLAIMAAPFDSEDNDNYVARLNENAIEKKRHSRTQKKYQHPNFNPKKVSNVLESIHNQMNYNEDDDTQMGDFKPSMDNFKPSMDNFKPSMDNFKPSMDNFNKDKDNFNKNNFNKDTKEGFKQYGYNPMVHTNANANGTGIMFSNNNGGISAMGSEDEGTNISDVHMNMDQVKEYYKRLLPGTQALAQAYQGQAYQAQSHYNTNSLGDNALLEKLNYVINLLEEQKDERTNNVTEEVVLYCFLGIFIIFVTDSFARVGKYVR
jgi:hypothetical protein